MPTEAEALLNSEKSDIWLARVTRPFEFTSPFCGREFVLMLVVASDDVSAGEQAALSDALVAQGCRWAVCAGHNCSSWDTSVDWAFLKTDPDFKPLDERFVMTTWHEDEDLEEIAWFFLWNTAFDDYVPSRFLALVVGGATDVREEVAAALRSAAERRCT